MAGKLLVKKVLTSTEPPPSVVVVFPGDWVAGYVEPELREVPSLTEHRRYLSTRRTAVLI